MTRPVLVTGGAGYVGSHTCLRLSEAGYLPVVVDNLSNGHRDFVQWGPLEVGDVRDGAWLDQVFARHAPIAVLHFAALIEVSQSTTQPFAFYDNNVGGLISVLGAARRGGARGLVFSSTCATYGAPQTPLLTEDHPQAPLSPYGRSKLMAEHILRDVAVAEGFPSVALRYFNAAGADPLGRIGERHNPETHAIPLAIGAAMGGAAGFSIYGDDYPTPDGTAVRDYVHVLDLADAHVRALDQLASGGGFAAYNLGTGAGVSVAEMIARIEQVCGRSFKREVAGRRTGDAAMLVADSAKARSELGWSPRFGIDDIVRTAFDWHRAEADRPAPPLLQAVQ